MTLFLTKNPYSLLSPYSNEDDLYEHIQSNMTNDAFKKECQVAFDCLINLESRFHLSDSMYLQDVQNDFMKFELLQKSISRQPYGSSCNSKND